MNIYNNRILSDADLVRKVRVAAKIYRQYAEKDVLIVYAKSKKGPFFTYEFHAGNENFQHLAGVKSPKGAEVFFNRCLDDVIKLTRDEIIPKDNIKITSAKIDVLPMAIDLKKAKAYRFGEKNLITLVNSFEMVIGNKQCVMGFDKRSYQLPIPITVMDRSIYEFCTEVCSISLIMLKSTSDEKYSEILYEITENIIQKANFDEDIRGKIKDVFLVAS